MELDIHSLFGTISCKRGTKTLSSAKYYHKPSHCNSILGMRLAAPIPALDWGVHTTGPRIGGSTGIGIGIPLRPWLGLAYHWN